MNDTERQALEHAAMVSADIEETLRRSIMVRAITVALAPVLEREFGTFIAAGGRILDPEWFWPHKAVQLATALVDAEAVPRVAALTAALDAITAACTTALADHRRGCPTYGLVSAGLIAAIAEEAR